MIRFSVVDFRPPRLSADVSDVIASVFGPKIFSLGMSRAYLNSLFFGRLRSLARESNTVINHPFVVTPSALLHVFANPQDYFRLPKMINPSRFEFGST